MPKLSIKVSAETRSECEIIAKECLAEFEAYAQSENAAAIYRAIAKELGADWAADGKGKVLQILAWGGNASANSQKAKGTRGSTTAEDLDESYVALV